VDDAVQDEMADAAVAEKKRGIKQLAFSTVC
jgi:hypothetical protein